jgi:hypothetical protein
VLKGFGDRADVLDGAAIFAHQVNVDVLGLQRRFEALEFEDCFVDLEIDAPEAFVWNGQLDDDAVGDALARFGGGARTLASAVCAERKFASVTLLPKSG